MHLFCINIQRNNELKIKFTVFLNIVVFFNHCSVFNHCSFLIIVVFLIIVQSNYYWRFLRYFYCLYSFDPTLLVIWHAYTCISFFITCRHRMLFIFLIIKNYIPYHSSQFTVGIFIWLWEQKYTTLGLYVLNVVQTMYSYQGVQCIITWCYWTRPLINSGNVPTHCHPTPAHWNKEHYV